MMDLSKKIELPVLLDDDGMLSFKTPLKPITPARRTIDDMRPYLADPDAIFDKPSVYDMYRAVSLSQDEEKLKKAGLRFDMTVFHPGLLGREFCKTIGHYHPFKPGTKIRYPETYEVVLGNAIFLMQRMDELFNQVIDVYAIEVRENEDVIFLPGFAHFLINPTKDVLITSNWSANEFDSLYEPVAKYHGAAYYVMKGAGGQPEFIPNKNYAKVPPLKKLRPKELPHFGLINNQPAYLTGQKSPDMLQFLVKPELYLKELTIENCYILE